MNLITHVLEMFFHLRHHRDFAWSPTDNFISYWTPEERDTPARVSLVKIPSRVTLCQKNLFQLKDCRLHWQKSGDYLCVKVDRYKSKKEEKDTVKYSVCIFSSNFDLLVVFNLWVAAINFICENVWFYFLRCSCSILCVILGSVP